MQPSDVANRDIFNKFKKIIETDGYNISNELSTELKTKCEVIDGNKLPIVG